MHELRVHARVRRRAQGGNQRSRKWGERIHMKVKGLGIGDESSHMSRRS